MPTGEPNRVGAILRRCPLLPLFAPLTLGPAAGTCDSPSTKSGRARPGAGG